MKLFLASTALLACAASALAADVGFVDFDGTETGLTAYSNPVYTYSGTGLGTDAGQVTPPTASTLWVAGDSFWPMDRANVGPNNIGMPFGISDDSVAAAAGNSVLATDSVGFAGIAYTNGFFGVTDTVNDFGSTPLNADFTFDITGATGLSFSVDVAAMGDAEVADMFSWSYSIDGGAFQVLLATTTDEAINQAYTMDSGTPVTLDDPLKINGIKLSDVYQNFSAAIAGTGNSLTIRFTAVSDGGTEGFGFDNMRIVPEPASLALLAIGGLLTLRRRG